MPNFIRTKQIDQTDLSGFFIDTIGSQSGLLLEYISGVTLNETVLLTGNQTISGVKTFASRPTFSGIELLINGDQGLSYTSLIVNTGSLTPIPISGLINSIVQINRYPPNGLVRASLPFGNNQYSGQKTTIMYNTLAGSTGNLQIEVYNNNPAHGLASTHILSNGESMEFYRFNVLDYNSWYSIPSNRNTLNSVSQNYVSKVNNETISGIKTFLNNLNVSGDLTVAGTLRYNEIIDTTVTGNLSGYTGIFQEVYANNLIYNTGNQNISGQKRFIESDIQYDYPDYSSPYTNLSLHWRNGPLLKGVFKSVAFTGAWNATLGGSTTAYTGIEDLTNFPYVYYDTGSFRWKFLYGAARNLVAQSQVISPTPFSSTVNFPLNNWVDTSTGSINLKFIPNTQHSHTHNLNEKDQLNIVAIGAVATTGGNQTISGNKIFKNNIQIGDSQNAIYSDGDSNLIISGLDDTPRGMKFILANNEKQTSITFDPDYHGLVFNGDSYDFINQRPAVEISSPFSRRPVALLDEVVLNTGNQTISGVKTFATGVIVSGNLQVSGTGTFNALDLNNIDSLTLSGVDINIISGNVGIGTDTPDQKLHVLKTSAGAVTADAGSIAVFEGSGNSHITILTPNSQTAGVVFGSPADNFGSYLSWNHDNHSLKLGTAKPSGFIQLLTNNEAEAVRITSGANVGIGTNNPSEKLEVAGNIKASGASFTNRPTVNNTGVLLSGQSPAISDSLVTHIRPSGTNNVFVSSTALASTSIGSQNNIAVGVNALTANVAGDDNVAMGHEALYSNINGNGNIGIGRDALKNANSPDANICIGTQAGDTIQAGGSNIIIGHEADVDNAGRQRCIVLGRSAVSPAIDGSLAIGGTAGNVMANLTGTSAGAAAGDYLNIYINGVQRKIALLLP